MLYKFRNCENMLKYDELEEEYLWFSNTSNLNDPGEGLINFFWQGDEVAWLGLFKNYAWQLSEFTCRALFLKGNIEGFSKLFFCFSWEFFSKNVFFTKRDGIADVVRQDKDVVELAETLNRHNCKISAYGLQFIFSILHRKFLYILVEEMAEKFEEFKVFDVMKLYFEQICNDEVYQKRLSELMRLVADMSRFEALAMKCYEQRENDRLKNTNNVIYGDIFHEIFFKLDFQKIYVERMRKFAFEDGYSCSFADDFKSSAMWGNYADNHKGLALIFDYEKSLKEIELEEISFDLNGNRKCKKSSVKCGVVKYSNSVPEFNWFYILGKLFADERSLWLIDNGKTSRILTKMHEDENKYSDSLFLADEMRMLRKEESWEYEQEYRFFRSYWLTDFYGNNGAGINYRYNFDALKGIIFGIRTSLEQKKKIIDIICSKCKKNKRDDFKFYQAYLDYVSGEVKIYELNIM